ncbi:MAG TPA: hypothetical protein H9713_06625 [Candidatus Mediterraneibacter surreyensis]|nr:hypothetical protein [Candidatus Mediterraneibacter surreyensis]
MDKKGMYIFRVILGGYLGYLGIKLLVQMSQEKPSNMILMSVMGALFVVVGVGYAIFSLKKVLDLRKGEESDESPVATEDEEADKEEKTQRRVNMQTVGTEQLSDDSAALKESTDSEAEEQVPAEADQESDGDDQETDEEIENDYEEK